jgi:UDP-N-acetyl-2-amino-2-deoxyglucuronate dehydrogenase
VSESVGFAVVGLGYGATRCELLAKTPNAHLAAVVDASAERARSAPERYGVPWFSRHTDVLENPEVDVVAIYTPSGMHLDQARDVAAAGKHVMLTKPIEVNLERSDQVIRACADAGVQLFGEFYLRYESAYWRLKSAADSGALGPLILGEFGFKCFRPDEYYRADGGWRQTWEMNGGGVVMNQTLHAIDLLTWCLGPIRTVSAITRTSGHGIPVEDTAAAVMTAASGAVATLVGTSTFRTTSGMDDMYGGGYTTRAEVNGRDGSITVVDQQVVMDQIVSGPLADYPGKPDNAFEDIARSLTEEGYSSLTLARPADMRAVVEIALAVYDSARTGEPVELGSRA